MPTPFSTRPTTGSGGSPLPWLPGQGQAPAPTAAPAGGGVPAPITPNPSDLFRQLFEAQQTGAGQYATEDFGGWNNFMKALASPGLYNLAGASGVSSPLAFGNLSEILARQGKTDPRMMNRMLSDAARTTQSQVGAAKGRLARGGMEGSGVGQAVLGAIGSAGADRRAGILSEEAQLAEARKRADLDLFMRMIMDPTMGLVGTERSANAARQQNQFNWGDALGAALQAGGLYLGGRGTGGGGGG